MEKKELKKKLNEQIVLLKAQCKDAHYAQTLLDGILSLKGQIDVKADERKAVSEIKESAYSLTRYDNDDIEFHINGMTTTFRPHLNVYHFPLNALLTCHDNYDTMDEESKENYENLLTDVLLALQMPTILFSDVQLTGDVMNTYVKYLNKKLEESQDDDNLPHDDDAKNEEFKDGMLFKEEIRKQEEKKKKK